MFSKTSGFSREKVTNLVRRNSGKTTPSDKATSSALQSKSLERKSSVDHFERLVKREMEHPPSHTSAEALNTKAREFAKGQASFLKRQSEGQSFIQLSSTEKEEARQKAQGWNAFAEGNPIPAGIPHNSKSEWRAQNALSGVLHELKPREDKGDWGSSSRHGNSYSSTR